MTTTNPRKSVNYRVEPELANDFVSYCKLKNKSQTKIIENAIKEVIKDKSVRRQKFNIEIPVYATYETDLVKELSETYEKNPHVPKEEYNRIRKTIEDKQTEIIGYVKFNNYLDMWDGETYCYETKPNKHKGICILETSTAKYPVIIRITLPTEKTYRNFKTYVELNKDRIRTAIIDFNEAIEEIEKSENTEIYEIFPEFKKYKNDPENYKNTKNSNIKVRSDIITYQNIITQLKEKDKQYQKMLEKCAELLKMHNE